MPLTLDRRRATLILGLAAMPTTIDAGPLSPDAFRCEVLSILAESFPERTFKPGAAIGEIVGADHQLYLGNLRATVGGLSADERRVEIIKWFSIILRDLEDDSLKNRLGRG